MKHDKNYLCHPLLSGDSYKTSAATVTMINMTCHVNGWWVNYRVVPHNPHCDHYVGSVSVEQWNANVTAWGK